MTRPEFICVEDAPKDRAFLVDARIVEVFRRHVSPTQADLEEVDRILQSNPKLAVRIVGIAPSK